MDAEDYRPKENKNENKAILLFIFIDSTSKNLTSSLSSVSSYLGPFFFVAENCGYWGIGHYEKSHQVYTNHPLSGLHN